MSNLKTYGAVAVMIGCFVVIYPRFMHPIFLNILGLREPPKTNEHEGYKGHPSERGTPRGGEAEEMRRHMRHGPHPGMRAAAEMQRQHGQQGSGRGMMGVVLPMYAVGIVLYLAYTLYKVFNKSHAKDSPYSSRYGRDKQRERDRMGFPRDFDGSQDIRNFLQDQQHRENLEDLLTRVDDKNVSVEEMRVLQKRLEETEAQMTRILNAMHAVNANMDNLKPEAAPGENNDGNESQAQEPVKEEVKADATATEKADGSDEEAQQSETLGEDNNAGCENNDKKENDGPDADGDNNDNNEDAVDELIEERRDDNDDETNISSVRQRNVKSNEQ